MIISKVDNKKIPYISCVFQTEDGDSMSEDENDPSQRAAMNALHVAAAYGNTWIVQFLLQDVGISVNRYANHHHQQCSTLVKKSPRLQDGLLSNFVCPAKKLSARTLSCKKLTNQ